MRPLDPPQTQTEAADELHVGQVGSTGRIFIGGTQAYYEKCKRPISGSYMHTLSITPDEAEWLIRALRKELRRSPVKTKG